MITLLTVLPVLIPSPCMQVRPERLPLYLSPDIAEKVLFVGRAVRVLKDPKGALKGHTLLPLQVRRMMFVK